MIPTGTTMPKRIFLWVVVRPWTFTTEFGIVVITEKSQYEYVSKEIQFFFSRTPIIHNTYCTVK